MGLFFLARHCDTDLETNTSTVRDSAGPGQNQNQNQTGVLRTTNTDAAPTASSEGTSVVAYEAYCRAIGLDVKQGSTSFDERVRRDYRWHTVQYWFVASLANGLLWVQIVVGAALTACGASHSSKARTATIYLGASSTVIAGLLTYFKSRNQPNRTRQFRNELRNVRNKMDEAAAEMRESSDPREAHARALEIIALYDTALKDSQANYPDLWVPSILREKTSKPNLQQGKRRDRRSSVDGERSASTEREHNNILRTQVRPHDSRRHTMSEEEENIEEPFKEKDSIMEAETRPGLKKGEESQDISHTSPTVVSSDIDVGRSATNPALD